jgi:hypothetical protein
VRPNQVYLTDGVARHFRLVAETGRAGAPAHASRVDVVHGAPGGRTVDLPPPLRLPATDRRTCSCSTPACGPVDARRRAPWLRDHCVIHSPWRDLRRSGAGTTRTSPTTTAAAASTSRPGTARSSAASIRQQCPDARIHHRGVLTSYGDGDDASSSPRSSGRSALAGPHSTSS